MKIRDLMTKQVATVRATDSTAVAARLMWDCDCGAVPVLDGDGRAIAMITDRDICMAALMRDARAQRDPRLGGDVAHAAVLHPRRSGLDRRGHHAHLPNQANPDRRQATAVRSACCRSRISSAPPNARRDARRRRSRPPRSPERSRTSARPPRARQPGPVARRLTFPAPRLSARRQCLCLRHVKGPARVPRPRGDLRILGRGRLQQAGRPGSGGHAQWSQVENVYQRRADLVPNLVETVKGAAKFEKDTFTAVTRRARRSARSRGGHTEIANDPGGAEASSSRRRTGCRRRCRG